MGLPGRISSFVARFKAASAVARSVAVLTKPKFFFSGEKVTFTNAVENGYKNLVWVYRCINAYSTSVSSVPWQAVQVNSDGTEKLLPGHELANLMNNPNKFFGRKEFFDAWTAHLFLAGKAYWEKVIVGKRPVELWSLRPDWVRPIPDPTLFISGWEFQGPGLTKPIPYDANELVEFKFIDPSDPYGAMTPLTAAKRTMETENAAIQWNKSMLDNAAVPGGIFKIPVQNTTKPQREELRLALEEEYGRENRFQTMILWGGMEWTRMSFSPQDMQFLEQRRLNKYEICSIFGVPPQMIGAQEDPTYSNYAVARLSFWEDSVIPLLEWILSKANAQLAPMWGPNIRLRYDLSKVPAMREAFAQKVNTGHKLWQMAYPINEINRRLNLGMEDVPWGDTAYLQINMAPIEEIGKVKLPLDTTPPADEPLDEPDDTAPAGD